MTVLQLEDVKITIHESDDEYLVDDLLDRKLVLSVEQLDALKEGKILVISPEQNAAIFVLVRK